MPTSREAVCAVVLLLLVAAPKPSSAATDPIQAAMAPIEAAKVRVSTALGNITNLQRPGQIGLATVWDGNKYVQCRRSPSGGTVCEAAGTLMQPSLRNILTPDRVAWLAGTGWMLDPSFGNYSIEFLSNTPRDIIASSIILALVGAYDADPANLQVETDWVADEPCPPRNGFSQNLAGMIDDAPSMAATAVHACAFRPEPDASAPTPLSAQDLIEKYGARATGEIQRLRVNADRNVFVVFDAEIGYVQCQPDTSPPGIYCEAQSAESWPALAGVLTSERIARLHALGFSDPGRAPNYWKDYPLAQYDDAAIADQALTILHDVYGYVGAPALSVKTEKGSD